MLPLQGAFFPRIFPTQRDALGYHIFGFQPKLLKFKMLHKLALGVCVRDCSGYPAAHRSQDGV